MLFSSWLRDWRTSIERRRTLSGKRRPKPPPRRVAPRLCLEALEDRTLLSTYLVTNTLDSGAGSLRQAILNANAANTGTAASPDLIQFNIPTSDPGYNSTTGAFSIKPLSALPTITDTLVLDGYTQPGASPNTLAQGDNAVLKIQLNLSAVAAGGIGLNVSAGNTTIRGLVLNGVPGNAPAIYVSGAGDHVEGSFIGTDVSGTQVAGNAGFGITLVGSNAVVGGTTPGARNIISGNGNSSSVPFINQGGIDDAGTGDSVQGNYIGTDVTGTKALGNGNSSVFVAGVVTGNGTIGGMAPGAGNLISGNQIGISPYGGVIQGNLIGTDVTGTSALGNGTGIFVNGPTTVGGNSITNPAAHNVISGNGIGIRDQAVSSPIEGNYIGTDITGTKSVGNTNGVWLFGGDTLGGTGAGDGNVISGNTIGIRMFGDNNVVQGNLIGTDYTGTKSVGNSYWAIFAADQLSNNVIGGLDTNAPGAPLAGGGNVISGNGGGVLLANGSGNVVEGNYVGTDIAGKNAIGNGVGVWLVVNATGNTIGGTTPSARNLISGNGTGIHISPGGNIGNVPSNNVVEGNYIGTDAAGNNAPGMGNGLVGINFTGGGQGVSIQGGNNNQIGVPGTGNLISGNGGGGVSISGGNFGGGGAFVGSSGNLVQGNSILQNPGGGIAVFASNSMVGGTAAGAGNVIAGNGGDGVFVGGGATSVSILSNSISASGGLGIHLDSATSANDNQAAPVLTAAGRTSSGTTVSGTLASVANTTFRIEFFANQSPNPSGYGEGLTLMGYLNVTTDGNGNASFTAALPALPAGQTVVSATATKLVGTSLTPNDTSQFSHDVSIPIVGPITASLTPVAINTTINTSASFTDAIAITTHTAVWNWGDGTTSSGVVTESNGSGTVTSSHSYVVDGIYTVTLTVTNNLGGSGQSVFNYVVVYNPSAGFVTGGGWFNSPAGADTANPTLTGKANFGFNAKYPSGSTVPTGQTEFQFPAANLDFHSTSYDWLVINGSQAQYQGSGTINGSGNYGFLVTVTDNDASSGGGADAIRIQIWDKNNNNAVVYDTQPGAALTAAPTTLLGGGDIQVHVSTAKTQAVVNSSGSTIPSGTSQPAPFPGASNSSSPVIPVVTSTPTASASGVSSNGGAWFTFQASLFDLLERDLSQWEAAMTQELASQTQIVDQLFADWERMALDSFGAIRHS